MLISVKMKRKAQRAKRVEKTWNRNVPKTPTSPDILDELVLQHDKALTAAAVVAYFATLWVILR